MSQQGRHRDDEDFNVITDQRDLGLQLLSLPKLPRQPDGVAEYGDDTIDIDMSDAISDVDEVDAIVEAEVAIVEAAIVEVAVKPPTDDVHVVSVHRVTTRPLDEKALEARMQMLAAERQIAEADGRIPMDNRYPGQGSARRTQ